MNWIDLTDPNQLDLISKDSKDSPILIFKYSTSCSISRSVLNRLERNWISSEMNHVKTYFLDLLSYRQISNAIAEKFRVRHESPQVLIIREDAAIYTGSHFEIDYPMVQKATRI